MAEQAKDWGLYGLYGEAIAVHPYSEKGFLHLGAKETGFLLGCLPASVSFKGIDEDREGRRGSAALFYMRIKEEPERVIYPPHPYRDLIQRVVAHDGLLRTVGDEREDPAGLSRVSVEVHRDDNQAFLRVEKPGETCRIRYGLGYGNFVCIAWTASTRTCRSLIQPRRAPGPGYTS